MPLALAEAGLRARSDRLRRVPRHLDRAERPRRDARREDGVRARAPAAARLLDQVDDRPPAGRLRRGRRRRDAARHARRVPAAHDQPRRRPIRSATSTTCPTLARPADFEHALCNCIGFGSKNSALVVSRDCGRMSLFVPAAPSLARASRRPGSAGGGDAPVARGPDGWSTAGGAARGRSNGTCVPRVRALGPGRDPDPGRGRGLRRGGLPARARASGPPAATRRVLALDLQWRHLVAGRVDGARRVGSRRRGRRVSPAARATAPWISSSRRSSSTTSLRRRTLACCGSSRGSRGAVSRCSTCGGTACRRSSSRSREAPFQGAHLGRGWSRLGAPGLHAGRGASRGAPGRAGQPGAARISRSGCS